MLHQDTVEAVKAYPDIVKIISDYVSLKKRGRNHVGLCPFHSEKSPSFYVSSEKRMFHCFGCHESGDSIAFIMKMDNLNFPDAIRNIAGKAGIEVIEIEGKSENPEHQQKREALLNILADTKDFYKNELSNHDEAMQYLKSRAITEETIAAFSIGYAPESGQFMQFLNQKAINLPDAAAAGILFQADNGEWVPRFKNRIIFPVQDHLGRTVGFGGRILPASTHSAKYINSPDSAIYNKSRIIYAFHQAKPEIRKAKTAILMEGYMDVVTAHQFGFKNAVAVMGTSFTDQQAQLLARHADTALLAMDSDLAGKAAIEKISETLKKHELGVKIIDLPEKDPADLLKEEGGEGFATAIESAEQILEYKIKELIINNPQASIEQTSKTINVLIPYLKAETDLIIRTHYINKIANLLKVERELIIAKMQKSVYTTSNFKRVIPAKKSKSKYQKSEEYILYISASNIDIRNRIKEVLNPEEFVTGEYTKLFEFIQNTQKINADLLEEIKNEDLRKVLAGILIEGEKPSQVTIINSAWEDCVGTLKSYKKNARIEEIKALLKEGGELGEAEQDKLLGELNQLVTDNY